jgi:hypothetical protein
VSSEQSRRKGRCVFMLCMVRIRPSGVLLSGLCETAGSTAESAAAVTNSTPGGQRGRDVHHVHNQLSTDMCAV